MLFKRDSTRRRFLQDTGLLAGGLFTGAPDVSRGDDSVSMPFENGVRPLVRYPQKRPLIRLTTRPPQLETPFSVFNEGILTPNDAFFVRYHLSESPPLEVDADAFRVNLSGKLNRALSLGVAELKSDFETFEIVAVNQCSGNGRGLMKPRVGGGQMGNGAMGNARWRGVRLRDVLNRAGVSAGARQVTFNGLDKPAIEKTPDFVKALDIDHALDGEVMLAYAMNGEDLPMLNGYPLRLVVPGYFGTYWVKHVHEITVIDDVFKGYWMATGYRIPNTPGGCVEPGTTAKSTVPIGRYNIRSFITSLENGARVKAGMMTEARGIAFDGGHGISEVLFTSDGGRTWRAARLGDNLGKYSFREWSFSFAAPEIGATELRCRATNRIGESQPLDSLWNPAGYMRNVVESINIIAV
ncbi:MAG: oxidase [Pedosphaera sp.]|nr:oxidase [Pedosphaera sp.]